MEEARNILYTTIQMLKIGVRVQSCYTHDEHSCVTVIDTTDFVLG